MFCISVGIVATSSVDNENILSKVDMAHLTLIEALIHPFILKCTKII